MYGRKSNFAAAPTVTILPLPPKPATPTGLEIRNQGNDWVFREASPTFVWRRTTNTPLIDGAGQEPLGAGQGAPSSFFSHWEVVIADYRPNDNVDAWLRNSDVTQPIFQYHIDLNRQDNAPNSPLRNFRVRVRAVDVFNQVSDWAWLDATNPYPFIPDQPIGDFNLTEFIYEATNTTVENNLSIKMKQINWQPVPDLDFEKTVIYKFDALYANIGDYATYAIQENVFQEGKQDAVLFCDGDAVGGFPSNPLTWYIPVPIDSFGVSLAGQWMQNGGWAIDIGGSYYGFKKAQFISQL